MDERQGVVGEQSVGLATQLEVMAASGRLPGQLRLRVRRHKRTVRPWWDYLLCTPDELEHVIAPTTWTLAAVQPGATAGGQRVANLELTARPP